MGYDAGSPVVLTHISLIPGDAQRPALYSSATAQVLRRAVRSAPLPTWSWGFMPLLWSWSSAPALGASPSSVVRSAGTFPRSGSCLFLLEIL